MKSTPSFDTPLSTPPVDIVGKASRIEALPFEIVGTAICPFDAAAANPVSNLPIMPEGFITYTDVTL
jgi:hypothetical protein